MKTCDEEGCDQPYSAKGLCKPHYEKRAYAAQAEQRRARARERYYAKRDEILASRRLITDELHERLMAQQGGVCAICGRGPSGRKSRLCVDHCHATGVVRGLLCDACNRGIGLLGDDAERLQKCVTYLLTSPPGGELQSPPSTKLAGPTSVSIQLHRQD